MKYTIKNYPELKKKVEQMSIEELLRAVICPAVSSDNEISRGTAARNMMCGWMRYKTPVVFVGYYNPYFGKTFEASVDTIINSHGFTEYTADAIVETLLGE